MVMPHRNRCLCIPTITAEDGISSKWCTFGPYARVYPTFALQEYISNCARFAVEKDTSKHRLGLVNLGDLKYSPFATYDLAVTRAAIQEEIPFKVSSCKYPLNCCGTCSLKCSTRCVQDVYHRLFSKCYNLYAGHFSEDQVPIEIKAALKVLLDPRATYASLIEAVNSTMKEEDVYDYAPITEGRETASGKRYMEVNPETGNVRMYPWPSSGLCPYCTPRVTYYKPWGRSRR